MFKFDFLGRNSFDDFGIYVEEKPPIPLPQKNVNSIEVPGRNGSLTEDDGTYKDIIIAVKCFFIDNDDLPSKIDSVKTWLAGGEGDLVFSNQSGKKYIGRVIDQIDIAQEYEILGEFQINFKCKPFKYAVNNPVITLANTPSTIFNPGTFKSEPVIKIYGTGSITLTINGVDLVLSNVIDYVTIDSILMDCYKDTALENNNMLGDFPVLNPGINTISWTGTVIKIEITPNWRWL